MAWLLRMFKSVSYVPLGGAVGAGLDSSISGSGVGSGVGGTIGTGNVSSGHEAVSPASTRPSWFRSRLLSLMRPFFDPQDPIYSTSPTVHAGTRINERKSGHKFVLGTHWRADMPIADCWQLSCMALSSKRHFV